MTLSEQDTRTGNTGAPFSNSNMEQLASPDAPSTRHLMHESSNGLLPPSNYASHPDFMGGGASLGRQFSIQLTPEQFEKLYLQPGTNAFQVAGWDERGRSPRTDSWFAKRMDRWCRCTSTGGFHETFVRPSFAKNSWERERFADCTDDTLSPYSGNPTVLGLAVFLVTLTPLSCYFMGFMGATSSSALTLMGTLYFSAGLGLYVSAILEWCVCHLLGSALCVVVC